MTIIRTVQLFLLPLVVYSASFNYDQCDATNGPFGGWGGFCQNQQGGTPINLCSAVPFSSNPTIALSGYSTPITPEVFNPGYTIQFNVVSSAPTMTAGNLAYTVGRATTDSVPTWQLAQLHLHWSRLGLITEGSEHYKQGYQYAAEAHLVHFNTAAGADLSAAVTSGRSDALLVVGVFLKAGDTDESATITQLANSVSTATTTPATWSSTVTFSDLYDGTGDFYSYAGGLTTPTCNEIVTWIVMNTPKTITLDTLRLLWAASTDPDNSGGTMISELGNYRPLVGTFGRTIYNTAGATDACSTVIAPPTSCNTTSTPLTTSDIVSSVSLTGSAAHIYPSSLPFVASFLVLFSIFR